jgi:hypothetical protein
MNHCSQAGADPVHEENKITAGTNEMAVGSPKASGRDGTRKSAGNPWHQGESRAGENQEILGGALELKKEKELAMTQCQDLEDKY